MINAKFVKIKTDKSVKMSLWFLVHWCVCIDVDSLLLFQRNYCHLKFNSNSLQSKWILILSSPAAAVNALEKANCNLNHIVNYITAEYT